jgi:hypothetical protein
VRRPAWILLLLLVTLAAACSSEGPDATASATDLRWLGRFGDWVGRYGASIDAANRAAIGISNGQSNDVEVRRLLYDLRGCDKALDLVTEPSNDRFDEAFDLAGQFCEAVGKAAESLTTARRDRSFSAALDARRRLLNATEVINQVDGAVERNLAANELLPSRAGLGSRIDDRLGRLATEIVGRSVEVRCWTAEDWRTVKREWTAYYDERPDLVGLADHATFRIHLAPGPCRGLAEVREGITTPERVAEPVQVLAHEIEHLRAPGYEYEVECRALQRMVGVAGWLGVKPAMARALADWYWREWYPSMPDEYRSDECRSGGRLDLRPETPAWPSR